MSFSFLNRFLNKDAILNNETILKSIEETLSGSGNRMRLVSALSVLCNSFNFSFNFKGLKDGYEAKERNLPSDAEIEQRFNDFKPYNRGNGRQWQAQQWMYGILATYGLRPHEIFAIDIEAFIALSNTKHELMLNPKLTEGIKTGKRIVFPLHSRWVELFDLKNPKILVTNGSFKNNNNSVNRSFRIAKIGFSPYDLRHAYAVRGHALGVPIREMADNMGHSVDMHTKTYQEHMSLDTRRIVYQNAMDRASKAKGGLTEVEQLKAEITSLKTENEQLKLLLTEYQLNGMLKR